MSDSVVRFAIRLTPRGGANRIEGVRDGVLLVRVAAAPVDGAANVALLRLLAEALAVPGGSLRIVGGESARLKRIEVSGGSVAAIRARWPDLAV